MSQQLSIAIIEDEPLLAMLLEEFIEALNHRCVGHASTVEAGLSLVRENVLDAAILDMNLGNETSWKIADELAARSIPFLIATGGVVGEIPARHQTAPMLGKPYALDSLEKALKALMSKV